MHIGKAKLSIRVLALTGASCLAILFLILGILGIIGPGKEIVQLLSSLLIGYDATPAGVIVGAVWGFLLGGLLGAPFAWLYNKML